MTCAFEADNKNTERDVEMQKGVKIELLHHPAFKYQMNFDSFLKKGFRFLFKHFNWILIFK